MLSTLFQGVAGGLLDPIPVISLGEGRVHPGRVALMMAEAAMQGANCTSGAILGFSIVLNMQLSSVQGNQQPSDH